jgi:hypothetical protein
MVLMRVPGESISSETLYNKNVVFRYEPEEHVRVEIWKDERNYTVQAVGHNSLYTLAKTETPELAYAAQREVIKLLNKGADIVITGLSTARLESLEEKIKNKIKQR